MILHTDHGATSRNDARGETQERRLSLLRCLQRMGFYDPEALLAQNEQPRWRLHGQTAQSTVGGATALASTPRD